MTWTLYLDPIKHDLSITNGNFARVAGTDEIIQRIKIGLWHYLGEFFLNTVDGTPWYESILGRKSDSGVASSILRARLLSFEGVTGIRRFEPRFNNLTREYEISADIDIALATGAETTISLDLSVNPEQ